MRQQIKQMFNVLLPWGGTRLQNACCIHLGIMHARVGYRFYRSSRPKLLTPSLVPRGAFSKGVVLIAANLPALVESFSASALGDFQTALASIVIKAIWTVLAVPRSTPIWDDDLDFVLASLLKLTPAPRIAKSSILRRWRRGVYQHFLRWQRRIG